MLMTAIASPSFWLPPSMRQRPKKRWLDRALDFRRWKRRLLDLLPPIGLAADGDTMLDPNGDLVLNTAGETELQDSTGCSACCPGCWDNASAPSVNITISGTNYPTGDISWSMSCTEDPNYGTSCDPCSADYFRYESGTIDGTYNVSLSSILVCPGPLGGPGPGGHWITCVASPVTYLFAVGVHTTQLVSTQFLYFDLKICASSDPFGCTADLQIFLFGCACDETGFTMFPVFEGPEPGTIYNPMPNPLVIDNLLSTSGSGDGACWGGTATITKGT